ncbi:MAG: hypothetical protein HYX92_03920 [Chloroflexi bacterium]|nr:hypothetical protein [Chloroflexota bacterium]
MFDAGPDRLGIEKLLNWVKAPYVWWREVSGFTPPVEFWNADGCQEIWLAK